MIFNRLLISSENEPPVLVEQANSRQKGRTYDPAGNLTGAADPDRVYSFTYDADNRLTAADNAGTQGRRTWC